MRSRGVCGCGCLLSALYPVCVGCLYDLYDACISSVIIHNPQWRMLETCSLLHSSRNAPTCCRQQQPLYQLSVVAVEPLRKSGSLLQHTLRSLRSKDRDRSLTSLLIDRRILRCLNHTYDYALLFKNKLAASTSARMSSVQLSAFVTVAHHTSYQVAYSR